MNPLSTPPTGGIRRATKAAPDKRFVIGLGTEATISKLVVEWRDGTKQEFTNVPIDGYYHIKQGVTEIKPAKGK